jgi:hypothetical protein
MILLSGAAKVAGCLQITISESVDDIQKQVFQTGRYELSQPGMSSKVLVFNSSFVQY